MTKTELQIIAPYQDILLKSERYMDDIYPMWDALRFSIRCPFDFLRNQIIEAQHDFIISKKGIKFEIHLPFIPRDDFLMRADALLFQLSMPDTGLCFKSSFLGNGFEKDIDGNMSIGLCEVEMSQYLFYLWYNTYTYPNRGLARLAAQVARIKIVYGIQQAWSYIHELWSTCWILNYMHYISIIKSFILYEPIIRETNSFLELYKLLLQIDAPEYPFDSAFKRTVKFQETVEDFREWLVETTSGVSRWLRGLFILWPAYRSCESLYAQFEADSTTEKNEEEIRRNRILPAELAVDSGLLIVDLGDPFESINSIKSVYTTYKTEGLKKAKRRLSFITHGRLHISKILANRIIELLLKGLDYQTFQDQVYDFWYNYSEGFKTAGKYKNIVLERKVKEND